MLSIAFHSLRDLCSFDLQNEINKNTGFVCPCHTPICVRTYTCVYILKMSRFYILSVAAYFPLSGFYPESVKWFVLRVITSRKVIALFIQRHAIQY